MVVTAIHVYCLLIYDFIQPPPPCDCNLKSTKIENMEKKPSENKFFEIVNIHIFVNERYDQYGEDTCSFTVVVPDICSFPFYY